jgi:clan AA aspartic protease
LIGYVDESRRALLSINVSGKLYGKYSAVTTWIDTAFDGHLVFSFELIKELELDALVETEAILADGSKVVLETYVCFVEWFGTRLPLQVIANDGKFPLLGTGLLEERTLHIDFANKTLTLN